MNREAVVGLDEEEWLVEVELPPMMADVDVDGEEVVVVVEEEPLVLWMLLMVEDVVAGVAVAVELEEFSSKSCWTWRMSTYSSRLAPELERLFTVNRRIYLKFCI